MKRLSEREFIDRVMALQRAHHIFVESRLTDNISIAFAAYQEVLADKEREIFLDTATHGGDNLPSPLDRYKRPPCPDCGTDMRIRLLAPNSAGWLTQWVCSNPDCNTLFTSRKSVEDWMRELEIKDGDV